MRHLPLWTVLVTGCGDPTLYPQYNGPTDGIVDTGVGSSVATVPLLCGRSPEGTLAQVDIVNQDSVAYELYTVDEGCNTTFQGRIEGGQLLGYTIANDLAWSVVDLQGRRVATFMVPSGSSVQWVEYIP